MKTYRTRQIFNDASLSVIAVESVDSRRTRTNTGCQMYGNIQPVAVVVCGPAGAYALGMEAEPADLDQLKRDIPELNASIAQFNSARS